jgi:hypothetical protein
MLEEIPVTGTSVQREARITFPLLRFAPEPAPFHVVQWLYLVARARSQSWFVDQRCLFGLVVQLRSQDIVPAIAGGCFGLPAHTQHGDELIRR